MQLIWTALPNDATGMVASIYWRGITNFYSSVHSVILHSLSYLRLPLSHLHLPGNLYLTPYRIAANNLLHFAYSWGHRLLILLYLAETEIKNDNKDKRTSIVNICHLPGPLPFSFKTTIMDLNFFNILTFVIFVGYFCLSGSPSYACLDPETPKKYFCLFVDFIVPCLLILLRLVKL